MKASGMRWAPPQQPLQGRGFLLLQLLALVLIFASVCAAEEEDNFSCHASSGLSFMGEKKERGAIIPRGDISVEVSSEERREVFCRFNASLIRAADVYFDSEKGTIKHEVVNSSTIRTEIFHDKPEKYVLFCKLERGKKADKTLCSQMVLAGYPPQDVTDFRCISMNYETVNCSWDKPPNPVLTVYKIEYSVPNFMNKSPCPHPNEMRTWCYFKQRFVLKDLFHVIITASNDLGQRSFVHRVEMPEIVIPSKVPSRVTLVGPQRAKVMWNLTYPMNSFYFELLHSVESRMAGESAWENVTYFFHKNNISSLEKDEFYVEVNLTHAFTGYEFRVRIHTGVGAVQEQKWSDYDVLSIKTKPARPSVAPLTSVSSFEVVEGLEERDIYVNFKGVDALLQAGRNFKYQVDVFKEGANRSSPIEPIESSQAYFKYKPMNFTDYKFRITPTNEMGLGTVYSEVLVPNSDCMPKKTGMFTVISSSAGTGSTSTEPTSTGFSLYWVPSLMSNTQCNGSGVGINSYTIYWCKRTLGDRCKEKLDWLELPSSELTKKDLSLATSEDIVIYEKNLTFLQEKQVYSFGIAANSGQYSSGIRWSSCIVDETEPPLPPVVQVEALANASRSVLVKWGLKCMSLSAVPVGFHIYYCKSEVQDFGHCTSEVEQTKVHSPSSSQYLVRNLDAGYSYIFSMAVESIIGEGRQSDPKIMRLRQDVPRGAPLALTLVSVSNTSATLTWNAPERAQRGGIISEYVISSSAPGMDNIFIPVPQEQGVPVKFELKGLSPFSRFNIRVTACTEAGCGYKTPAYINITTAAGVPAPVESFILDVSNWRLLWGLERCNSRNCSFEVKVPFNETADKIVAVNDKETLSLREQEVPCNQTEMRFHIRAKGQDAKGNFLYTNWTSVAKDKTDCPPAFLAWWVICLVVSVCVVLTSVVLLIIKYGWRTIMKAIKDCKQKINLPKGIQGAESPKEPLKDFSPFPTKEPFPGGRNGGAAPPLLLTPSPAAVAGGNAPPKTRADSVSSEEVHLIDASDSSDRIHGRNFSGSSGHSSSQDSAMVSGCPSLNQPDIMDLLPSEITYSSLSQETTLRQRSPVPPYVQHGVVPEKSEGYVTACSVPSLPHLYKEGFEPGQQQSTPDLKTSLFLAEWRQNARRASTGYSSMPDSDNDREAKESPLKGGAKDLLCSFKDPALTVGATHRPSDGYTGLPPYSRHSFSPEMKQGSAKGGYVTLADGRSPSPPSAGYVSAGDPFGTALRRPPSLPLLSKSFSAGGGEGELPLGAYCRVGSRGNQGYVSAGPTGASLLFPPQGASNPPYVSCGEAVPTSLNKASQEQGHPATSSPYVELKDGGRWAHPIQPPNPAGGDPHPPMNRVGPLPRPNTTEATMGHPPRLRGEGNPSLSKQSSGYVSQETILPCLDAVVMSPKRLFLAQAPGGGAPPGHQASMV